VYLLGRRQYEANFQGNPLLRAAKRHLNNSETVKNNEKLYERRSNLSFLLLVVLCSVLAGRMKERFFLTFYVFASVIFHGSLTGGKSETPVSVSIQYNRNG